MDKNLQKLNRLFSLMDEDSLTKEQFLESFANVIKMVKRIEDKTVNEVKRIDKMINESFNKLKNDNDVGSSELKKGVLSTLEEKIKSLDSRQDSLVKTIQDKVDSIKDGIDADEGRVIGEVYKKIVVPTKEDIVAEVTKSAEAIRDGLELLTGEARLNVSSIDGLEELIKNNTPKALGSHGGFSAMAMERHFIDDEELSGTKDGANKVFTIMKTPATGSLKVFRNGQRLRVTEDYTVLNKTITLIIAPESDEVLLADYRA